jgi:hypothetical protein
MFFISCYAPLYIPNGVNVPLLKEKGDFNLRLGYSFDGYDLQSSYAISNQIGLMFNGTYCPLGYADSYRKHKFIEMGIGYFENSENFVIIEIYSGLGIGTSRATEDGIFDSEPMHTKGRYMRFFTQIGIGYRHDVFDIALCSRGSYIDFYYIDNPNTRFVKRDFRLEPVFFIGVGPPIIRYETQLGFSFNFYNPTVDFFDLVILSGFSIRLNF